MSGCKHTNIPRPQKTNTPIIIDQPAPKGTDIIGTACYIAGATAIESNVKLTCKPTGRGNRWLAA